VAKGTEVGGDPAARLHRLLSDARGLSPQSTMRRNWAKLLGVDPDDRTTLLKRLGEVIALPEEVRLALMEAVQDHEDVARHLPEIEKALSLLNLDSQQWQQFTSSYSDTALRELEFISRDLRQARDWPTASSEDLDRIREQAQALLADVLSANLDQNLQDFLLRRLREVRDALELFKVSPDALLEAVRGATCELALSPPLGRFRRHRLVRALGGILTSIVVVVGATNQAWELAERVQRVFEVEAAAEDVEEDQDLPDESSEEDIDDETD
jgi:hypothetical protein